ncbi:MAG: DUF6029 family protein [Bacteroidota bacterium]
MKTKNIKRSFALVAAIAISTLGSMAQTLGGGSIHGNFEANGQYYMPASKYYADSVPNEKMLGAGFANFIYANDNFSAGFRYETYMNSLLGFPQGYSNNSGIPYRFITYKNEGLEVTAGNFYEQFGSGLIYRTYEERGLGYDNAMEGLRIKYSPVNGVYFKGIIGKERLYFNAIYTIPGLVRGFDGEVNLNEAISSWAEHKTKIIIGGSFVSKYQTSNDPFHVLPVNVGASAGRLNIIRGNLNLSGEYAYKINDPSASNGYIYKDGQALLVNANYSKKGFGITLSAERVDNMDFRADRNAKQIDQMINFLPVLAKQHTYALAAFYPYASQANGEMGVQAELFYIFKPNTFFGGKYGTNIDVNYSQTQSIDRQQINSSTAVGKENTKGYTSNFFKIGKEVYFHDINMEVTKKVSKTFKFVATYMNIICNRDITVAPGDGTVNAQVAVLEMFFKVTDKKTIRTEMQHLSTMQDQKNWAMGLIEYTIAPHWYVAALDLYNYSNPDKNYQLHYPNLSAGFTKNANRFAIGYGKQRAGIFCVGGLCRQVPASNGITLSITSSF